MKKKILIILVIITLSSLMALIDFKKIERDNKPFFTIKIINKNKETYIGPLYSIKKDIKTGDNYFYFLYIIKTKVNIPITNNKIKLNFAYDNSDNLLVPYFNHNNTSFYLKELDHIKINNEDFKDYYKRNSDPLKIITSLSDKEEINRKYYYKMVHFNNLKMMFCNTSYDSNEENKKIVIMKSDSDVPKDFCQKDTCLIRKTIKIIDKLNSNDKSGNINILLNNKKYTVTIDKENYLKIKENDTYDFTFLGKTKQESINIYDLFLNSKIIKVKDNTGKSYNDNYCY